MAKKSTAKTGASLGTLGRIAFIAGVIIALVAGFISLGYVVVSVLMILGLIVGLLNIGNTESQSFLFAAVALVIVASLGGASLDRIAYIGPALSQVFAALLSFVVPATIVVALRALFGLARE